MRQPRFLSILLSAAALGSLTCRARTPQDNPAAGDTTAAAAEIDARDQLLHSTLKVGLPPGGVTPADLPDPQSRGAVLTARYCSQCHSLPTPQMHGAADWPGVVRRMWLRVERLPADQPVQTAEIGDRIELLNYLSSHALQVSRSTLPPGRGRNEFITACSRCHALPDPHLHGPQDWSAVLVRMERNMERMNVRPVSRDEIGGILEYLQGPGTAP